jgi:hypothetical protein
MRRHATLVLTGILLGGVVLFLTAAGPTEDARYPDLLRWTNETVTKTVGQNKDFETLKEALDWSSKRVFINGGSLTIGLAPGEHILECYDYRNMNARNVFIKGPSLKGKMPLASEMKGEKSADIELIKSRFEAWIKIQGSQKYGLALPYGIGGIDNLAIINPDTFGDGPTRYTISCGLLSSWETSETSASIRLGKVAIVGGVWGINAVGCRVVNKNDLFFAYHYDGGPIHLSSNSQYRSSFGLSNSFQAYVPNAQYGMICHDSSAWMDYACTIKGANIAFLANGGGARIDARAANVVDCQVVASAESGGVINIPFHVATNCDASPGTAIVELWKGYAIGKKAIYFAGAGSLVNIFNAQINGVSGNYGFYAVAGGRIIGPSITMNDFFFDQSPSGALAYVDRGSEMIVGIAATNPRPNSSTRMVADNGGRIYAQRSTGVTYEPSESGKMNSEGSLVVQ